MYHYEIIKYKALEITRTLFCSQGSQSNFSNLNSSSISSKVSKINSIPKLWNSQLILSDKCI